MEQPQSEEPGALAGAAIDDDSPVSVRQADFLQMRRLALAMFPDPVLPDDGLPRRVRS